MSTSIALLPIEVPLCKLTIAYCKAQMPFVSQRHLLAKVRQASERVQNRAAKLRLELAPWISFL
ncbi:MAG: hypothetical protein ACK5RG_09835 [Cyclobacteriaceae bacterium]|jgi:hypothetical protein|nr:hypothetical protein [Flammeovirgaceae bacterium]